MTQNIDPELLRQDDDDELQHLELESRWARLFETVESVMVGDAGGGFVKGTWRVMFKGFLWQAKKRVAAEPDGTRRYVVESMQVIAACLEIEPLELFPDLKPKEPAVA